MFTWLVAALGRAGLVKGKAIGIDATTLEANAAIKSIVRRDTVESCDAFLTKLALASGIDTPTRAEPAKIDKHRKHKGNNDDWQHRHDPDAKITKTKDGRTHLAHKTEHAVDFAGGAVAGVTVQPANEGNTTTCRDTVETACRTLNDDKADPIAREKINEQIVEGLVDEKSCHGNQAMVDLKEMGICSHTSDPDRGRRNRQGDKEVRDAVYGNRTPSGPGANTNSWRFDHIAPKEIIETMKKRAWVSGSEATNNE